VAEAMLRWANPASPHAEGRAARAALEDCRQRITKALGWEGQLVFTSGASESLAIALGRGERRVVASAVEHDAVFRAAPGAQVLPIGSGSQVSREALEGALRDGPPPIVAVQHVNPETGIVQPVAELAAVVRAAGGLLLSDCSQSAGKLPLPDADMVVLSAHKLGGPPGIGALLVRDPAMLQAIGGQEQGFRPGTQNLPGAAGFAAAVETWRFRRSWQRPDALPMVEWLLEMSDPILDLEYAVGRAGGRYQPVPTLGEGQMFCSWIQAITMPGVSAAAQLIRFDMAGIAVSAGSACSSGTLKASRTLRAFGVPEDEANCTIRVSFGWPTTADDIQAFRDAWLNMADAAPGRAA
jgi:cysteine desulfurase